MNHDTLVGTPIVGGPYEGTIPPPLAYGGFIVSQHPHLHYDGGDWHEVLGKGLKKELVELRFRCTINNYLNNDNNVINTHKNALSLLSSQLIILDH